MKLQLFSVVLALALAACGGGGGGSSASEDSVGVAEAGAMAELLGSSDEADSDVEIEVASSQKPATVSTQYTPAIGGQTIYEVSGKTRSGKPFRAVLLGDEGIRLADYKGQVRIKARKRQIQGQTVLAGRLIPKDQGSGLNPIAFIAAAPTVKFSGPAAGTVYQVSGNAEFNGTCADDGLAGSYSLKLETVELTGALTGLREGSQAPACTPGKVEATAMPIALSYTAVDTHMGVIFSFQGSLAGALTAAADRPSPLATRALSGMPSQGITVAGASLPTSTMRASATLKNNVKELGGTSGAELVSFSASDGTLIFGRLTGNLRSLAVGDILSSVPRTGAPNGFLRKVTRIQNTADGKVEVLTAKANVGELLDEADISFDQPFDSNDVQRATELERGKVVFAATQLAGERKQLLGADPLGTMRPAAVKISESFNLVLFDQDGNSNTTDDQVTVRGSFRVAPRIVVEFKCRRAFCSDPEFLGKFVLEEDAEIIVSAKLKKELRESRRIARIPLPAITAGPLIFVPDIVVTVDLEGVVRAEVEVGATQNLSVEAGVRYNGGFTKINNVTTDVGIVGPTFEGSVEAKAGIYAALRLMLYGVAGVSAEAGPYAKFRAQYPGTPAWTMQYGIEGNLGVDIDLLIFGKEWDTKLFDTVFDGKTKVAPDEPPRFLDIGSKYQCDDGYSARIGAAVVGGLPPVRLYAQTDDKEDGPGSGSIDWSSNLDGSLGRTRKADRHSIAANLRNGTHVITAVLSDNGNNRRTREFTVQLGGSRCQFPLGLPDVDILGKDQTFPLIVLDVDRSLTLQAQTSQGSTTLSPFCSNAVTWKSNLERRNAGTSTGVLEAINDGGILRHVCRHTFSNTYKNLSAQTISAKFSVGGLTVTDSIDVGALIPRTLSMGQIQFSAPSATRYVYEGDQVTFSVDGSNVSWSSSVASDNINGRSGNTVNGRFTSTGPRTIMARIEDGQGGFVSRSLTINVLSALARP